ncbi:MAG TPA: glycosyltransferase family 39 protein [Planctomycetota bacterium]|nr:glycosyltransferase family 39 protein [Planctomycetota bacterium]
MATQEALVRETREADPPELAREAPAAPPSRRRWAFGLAIALAVVLGGAMRTRGLATEPFWHDEVSQIRWTEEPFAKWASDRWDQIDPPLNELVAYGWNAALRALAPDLAWREWAIRLPPFVFGTATIAVLGLAGATAFGPFAGAVAAFLLAVNPFHVRFSQEARMYALLGLLAAVSLLFLARALRADRRRDGLLFGAAAAATVYAHYHFLLAVGLALVATSCLRPRPRWLLRGELLAFGLTLPWIAAQAIHSAASGMGRRDWLLGVGIPNVKQLPATGIFFSVDWAGYRVGSFDTPANAVTTIAVASLALALLLSAIPSRDDARGVRLHLLLIGIGAPLVTWAVSQIRPVYQPRYLLFAIPALVLLAASVRPRALAAALALAPMAASIFVGSSDRATYFQKPAMDRAAVIYRAQAREGDRVVVSEVQGATFAWYVEREGRGMPPAPVASHAEDFALVDGSRPYGDDEMEQVFGGTHSLFAVETWETDALLARRRAADRGRWTLLLDDRPALVFHGEEIPRQHVRLWRRDP